MKDLMKLVREYWLMLVMFVIPVVLYFILKNFTTLY